MVTIPNPTPKTYDLGELRDIRDFLDESRGAAIGTPGFTDADIARLSADRRLVLAIIRQLEASGQLATNPGQAAALAALQTDISALRADVDDVRRDHDQLALVVRRHTDGIAALAARQDAQAAQIAKPKAAVYGRRSQIAAAVVGVFGVVMYFVWWKPYDFSRPVLRANGKPTGRFTPDPLDGPLGVLLFAAAVTLAVAVAYWAFRDRPAAPVAQQPPAARPQPQPANPPAAPLAPAQQGPTGTGVLPVVPPAPRPLR